jgi:hypothetical protein
VAPKPTNPRPHNLRQNPTSSEIPIAPAYNTEDSFSGYFRTPKSARNSSRKENGGFGLRVVGKLP